MEDDEDEDNNRKQVPWWWCFFLFTGQHWYAFFGRAWTLANQPEGQTRKREICTNIYSPVHIVPAPGREEGWMAGQ